LGDRLIDRLSESRGDPLVPEIVIPQNPVIGRWLTFRMADRTGICANLSMPLAGRFIRELLEAADGGASLSARFDKETLLFRLFERLPPLAESEVFGPVRSFIGDPPKESRLYDLSSLLADLYDRSMIYRPDLLLSWERGEGEKEWPAILWRDLSGGETGDQIPHRARLMERFFQRGSKTLSGLLPPRLFVFGLTGLPPQDLQFLRALGERGDPEVHLFFLNPCEEYWGDIVSPEEKGRKSAELSGYFDVGHPLLSSWGAQFRTAHQALSDVEEGERDFSEEGGKTLLGLLQSDIRHLRNRGEEVRRGALREVVPETDRSLEIVSCSGAVREIELLKDRLLALFSEDPTLRPEEIVVLAPDLSRYIGAIGSVFGRPDRRDRKESSRGTDPFIPYTVSDRRELQDEAAFEALLSLLGLPESRATAPLLLRLLSVGPIADKFALGEVRAARLKEILVESGMRWGRNGSDRPAPYAGRNEHTFREGKDRLLLGYACGEEGAAFTLEGSPAPVFLPGDEKGEITGALCAFLEAIDGLVESLSSPLPPDQWPGRLYGILETFFVLDPEKGVDREILALPGALSDTLARAGFDTPVSSSLVGLHLKKMAGGSGGRDRFFSGGVTFGQMVPLRSIPFRVLCLLGMNDADYPRIAWPPSFDWLASDPRPGDRSVRDDDRTLFLEALMSARDFLWISYEGVDLEDGRPKDPSVLVRQLLDVVGDGFAGERGPIEEQIVLEAPVDPMSPAHYGENSDPRLASFSGEWLSAVPSVDGHDPGNRVFYPRELGWPGGESPESGESRTVVALGDVLRFFRDPVRDFLTRVMGLSLGPRTGLLEEDEPFLVDPDRNLKKSTGGGFSITGSLPWPPLREVYARRAEERYRDHSKTLSRLLEAEAPGRDREGSVPVDILSGDLRLRGVLDPVATTDGRAVLLVDRWPEILYPSVFLEAFFLHLVLCSLGTRPGTTLLAGQSPDREGKEREEEFWKWDSLSPEKSRALLSRYLKAFRKGRKGPLLFDPEISLSCVEVALKHRRDGLPAREQRARGLEKASRKWKGDRLNTFVPRGAVRKPRNRSVYWTGLAFAGRDWIGEPDFYRWARLLWEPVLTTRIALESSSPSGSGAERP
jgi:exodeoxyribonuclease V gamma subunit